MVIMGKGEGKGWVPGLIINKLLFIYIIYTLFFYIIERLYGSDL